MCPFHGDCLEGVASGPAIQRRWQSDLSVLPEDHVAYSIIGGYLGQLAATIALVVSAERIVFASSYGDIWLTIEPTDADEAGTGVVTSDRVFG